MGSLINDLARLVNQALMNKMERKLSPLPQFSPMQLSEPSRSYSLSLAHFPGRRRAVERVIPPYYRRSKKSEYFVTEQEIISKIAQEDSDKEKLCGADTSRSSSTSMTGSAAASSSTEAKLSDNELYRQEVESKLWELFEQKSAETLQQISNLGAPYGAHYYASEKAADSMGTDTPSSETFSAEKISPDTPDSDAHDFDFDARQPDANESNARVHDAHNNDIAPHDTIYDAGGAPLDHGETQSFVPMDCPAQFGKISVERIHDDRNQTGMIRNIGAFLLDPEAVAIFERFISSGRSSKYMKSLNLEQDLALTRLQEYLVKQEEVNSTIVIGQDGMVLSSRQAEGIDLGTFASWTLCAYVNSKTVAQKLTGSKGPKHIVLSNKTGTIVISEFGQALLVTMTSANSSSLISSLMEKLESLLD